MAEGYWISKKLYVEAMMRVGEEWPSRNPKEVCGWSSIQTYAFAVHKESRKTLSQIRETYPLKMFHVKHFLFAFCLQGIGTCLISNFWRYKLREFFYVLVSTLAVLRRPGFQGRGRREKYFNIFNLKWQGHVINKCYKLK